MKMKKCLLSLALTSSVLAASTLDVSAAAIKDIFNAQYYSNKYKDLEAAFGKDEQKLYQHYINSGKKEGRIASELFDVRYYRSKYVDLNAAFGDNWSAYVDHYLNYGTAEGRDGGGSFDAVSYANRYPDLLAAFGYDVELLYKHYQEFGKKEGRNASSQSVIEARALAAAKAAQESRNSTQNATGSGETNNAVQRSETSNSTAAGGGSTSTGGSTTGNGTTGGGTTGGSTAGGGTTGDSTTGGSTAGGDTTGDSTAGGDTTGDSTTGGSTAGGGTTGDSTTGGSTAGDGTTGDSTAGDGTTGDNTTGDSSVDTTTVGVGTVYRTAAEIQKYMANSGASVGNATTVTGASLSAPYAVGTVAQDALTSALAMFNQVRYIAGLDDQVTLNSNYIDLAQAGALTNAINNSLSHTPTQPVGMDAELYNKAYTGASSSNIAWSSNQSTLSSSILGWMDDSDSSNISRLGHRRWILNPTLGQTGFGYVYDASVGTYSSMYAFDNSNSGAAVTGVAWPAREMPVSYFGNNMAWSYSYGSDLSDVSVTLKCLTAGKEQEWNFSASSANGYFNVENSNYGQKGCVIFRPDGISIAAGDQYLVTINQAGTVIANYTVNFF